MKVVYQILWLIYGVVVIYNLYPGHDPTLIDLFIVFLFIGIPALILKAKKIMGRGAAIFLVIMAFSFMRLYYEEVERNDESAKFCMEHTIKGTNDYDLCKRKTSAYESVINSFHEVRRRIDLNSRFNIKVDQVNQINIISNREKYKKVSITSDKDFLSIDNGERIQLESIISFGYESNLSNKDIFSFTINNINGVLPGVTSSKYGKPELSLVEIVDKMRKLNDFAFYNDEYYHKVIRAESRTVEEKLSLMSECMLIKGESSIRDMLLALKNKDINVSNTLCKHDSFYALLDFSYKNFAVANYNKSQIFGQIKAKDLNSKMQILYIEDIFFKKINKTNKMIYDDVIHHFMLDEDFKESEMEIFLNFANRFWENSEFSN